MAKKKSGSNEKKTASKKKTSEPNQKEAQKSEQKPAEKIKVNRSRRRLYETPKEGDQNSSVKKAGARKTASKRKKTKPKSVSAGKKSTPKEKPKVEKKVAILTDSDGKQHREKNRLNESNRIVEKYSAFASGSVLLPIPVIDIVYVTGIQLKMLSELSKIYDIEFKRNRGKAVVTSLISGIFTNRFMFSTAPFLVRYIPVVGFLMAPLSIVLFSSALTYSVGKVFIQHFEAGGTFLNFKPDEVRAHFKKEFENKYQVMKDDS